MNLEHTCKGALPYFKPHTSIPEQMYLRDDGFRCGPCMVLTLLSEGDISGFNKIMDDITNKGGEIKYDSKDT